jgi:predicted RNA-binding Zn-ribbon protein involved in translation (DUF1610 family)
MICLDQTTRFGHAVRKIHSGSGSGLEVQRPRLPRRRSAGGQHIAARPGQAPCHQERLTKDGLFRFGHRANGGWWITEFQWVSLNVESGRLENGPAPAHIRQMTNGTQAIVHFICPHCDMIYVATQKKSPEQLSGDFHCGACGISVHEWTGFYDFSDWKQVTMKPMR